MVYGFAINLSTWFAEVDRIGRKGSPTQPVRWGNHPIHFLRQMPCKDGKRDLGKSKTGRERQRYQEKGKSEFTETSRERERCREKEIPNKKEKKNK